MATSTAPDLRPLGVGEILDAAFKLYRDRFKTLVLCVLVPVVPIAIVSAFFQASLLDDSAQAGQFDGGALAGFLITTLLGGLLSLLATAACVRAISAAYLGEEVTWQESLRFGLRRLLPLIGASILVGLAIFAGFILLVIPAFIVWVRLAVVTPALIVEDLGPGAAFGRSWNLVKGRFWPTAGARVITALLVSIVAGILQGLLIVPLIGDADSDVLAAVLTALGQIVSSAFTLPLHAAILTILYFDLRVRQEGLDVELLARDVGGSGPADVARSSGLGGYESSPPPSGSGGFSAPPPSEGPRTP